MLQHLKELRWNRTRSGRRKLRLLGCACARRPWRLLDAEGRRQIEMAEELADGLRLQPTKAEVSPLPFHLGSISGHADKQARAAAHLVLDRDAMTASASVAMMAMWVVGSEERARTGYAGGTKAEKREQARLVREIAGNPFRPVKITPAWLVPTVVQLAQAAYDERILPSGFLDTARLAVLADALEEAGAAGEIVDHLRCPGPHVRGCFVIDALTARP
jgi:hypothetical protein